MKYLSMQAASFVQKMKRKILLFCTCSLASYSAYGADYDFSNVYSFGDSFVTPDTWVGQLGTDYGFPPGINGYSTGNGKNSFTAGGLTAPNLQGMIASYKQTVGNFKSNALYIIYTGASDSAEMYNNNFVLELTNLGVRGNPVAADNLVQSLQNGTRSVQSAFPQTANAITVYANDIANIVKTMSDGRAGYIVVPYHFTDFLRQSGGNLSQQKELVISTFQTNLYNQSIRNAITQLAPKANVIFVNYSGFINEMVSAPNQYFTNDQINGTFHNTGVFNVGAHETDAGNSVTRQFFESILESPARVAMIREVGVSKIISVGSDARDIASDVLNKSQEHKFFITVDGDYHRNTIKGLKKRKLDLNANNFSAKISGNVKPNDDATIGMSLSYARNVSKFNKNYGGFDGNGGFINAYGGYNIPQTLGFVYASLGAGYDRYKVKRKIPIGIAVRQHNGKTITNQYFANIGAGYAFLPNNNMQIVPTVSATYGASKMSSYTEPGNLSTAMRFAPEARKVLLGTIGVELKIGQSARDEEGVGAINTVKSKFGIYYSYDAKSATKKVAAGMKDIASRFNVPGYDLGKHIIQLTAGVGVEVKQGITASINLDGTARKNDYSVGGTVGIQANL